MNKYKKEDKFSYTLGMYPTLELIKNMPQLVCKIFFSSKLEANESKQMIESFCKDKHIAFETNDKAISTISDKENCYVMGVFKKETYTLDNAKSHIVLVCPENMGNAGTIIRTILGFNYKDLAIIKPAIDIYNPKVVRASMGALFSVNIQYFDSFNDYQDKYPNRDIFTFMLKGKTDLKHVRINNDRPHSLVFGSESSGLAEDFLNIGTSVKIEQTNRIDSLNLTIAVAIASYYFSNRD